MIRAALLALALAASCADSAGRIEEDDPRWDCRTMGNRVCGPTR